MLTGGGTLLGLMERSPYEEVSVEIESGDRIYFYTDGVTDAQSPDGDDFGEELLCRLIQEHRRHPPGEALHELMQRVVQFEGGAARTDDLTVIVLERT